MTAEPAPAAPLAPVAPPAPRRVPVTLYILAALILVKAIAFGAVVLGASFPNLRNLARSTLAADLVEAIAATPGALVIVGAISLLLLATGILLLRGRRLGWLLAMVTTGLFVAGDIYGFLTGGINHVWMLLNIVTVFYLNQADVREVVGAAGARRPVEPAP